MLQPGEKGSHIDGEAGSTTVEMAIVLPLFLLLVFGIFEFGRIWLIVNTMNHATREALRLAATTAGLTAGDSTATPNTVTNKATTILGNAGIIGAFVTNTAPAGSPREVVVNIVLTYTWMTQIGPLLGFSFIGNIPLVAQATMRYER